MDCKPTRVGWFKIYHGSNWWKGGGCVEKGTGRVEEVYLSEFPLIGLGLEQSALLHEEPPLDVACHHHCGRRQVPGRVRQVNFLRHVMHLRPTQQTTDRVSRRYQRGTVLGPLLGHGCCEMREGMREIYGQCKAASGGGGGGGLTTTFGGTSPTRLAARALSIVDLPLPLRPMSP